MADIQPFRGIRPRPDAATQVTSPPYDVVNRQEAKAFVQDRPHSFLRVVKPEIELDDSVPADDPQVFAHGAANLRALRGSELMVRDEGPCFYLYQQRMGDHVQVGLVAGASVDEYNDGRIKKHEHTRAKKEDERTRHVEALGAHTGPVFLTYAASPAIDALVAKLCAGEPTVDMVSEDGNAHTLWVVDDSQQVAALQAAFVGVDALYVADGHHRSAAAARVRELRRQRSAEAQPDAPWNWFLAVLFPHNQMKILEYNRVVLDLNGHDVDSLLAAVGERFELVVSGQPSPARRCCFGMYLGGRWHRLTARAGSYLADDPVASLDVAILQDQLLGPVLGVADPRTSDRIDFVGGIRGTEELERRADAVGGVAFAMHATSIEQLMAIADAGEVMPPKSTWFEPKLRSGMVVRSIDD